MLCVPPQLCPRKSISCFLCHFFIIYLFFFKPCSSTCVSDMDVNISASALMVAEGPPGGRGSE
uniref:Uncharacterized protein n=1 Tax=Anguilla anguilla TaxID=7936 RepID=A0A0E9WCK3_ANGAN